MVELVVERLSRLDGGIDFINANLDKLKILTFLVGLDFEND